MSVGEQADDGGGAGGSSVDGGPEAEAGWGGAAGVGGAAGTGNVGGAAGSSTGGGPAGAGGSSAAAGAGGTAGAPGCNTGPDEDFDKDGYTTSQGDCNDCDPNVNPGAYDVVSGHDEDCDGVADNEPIDCDDGLAIDDSDAMATAKALDICRTADPNGVGAGRTWGVLSARYVKADGTPGANTLSHGLLEDFGASEVQRGHRMLALSSGVARAPGQQDYQSPEGTNMGTQSLPPAGYPKESSSCPGVISGECDDSAALELEIRVPTNATSLAFNVGFYTHEFPQRICTEYNDFYVTMIEPVPSGAADGNISLDGDGNPISVNSTSFQVCESQQAGGKTFPCTLGPGLLADTGFEGHAATGWLESTVPVERGSEITLRFAIWDSGDAIHDSTVLIDNFQWSVEAASDM